MRGASLATADPESIAQLGYLGTTAAHLGLRDEALDVDRRLKEIDRPYIEGTHTLWRARIAAALGDPENAYRLLHQALREGVSYGTWLHTDPDFESTRDYAPFQELIRPKR